MTKFFIFSNLKKTKKNGSGCRWLCHLPPARTVFYFTKKGGEKNEKNILWVLECQ